MKVLGIQAFFPDSSVSLVENGKVVSAVQEERLTRNKRTRVFPFKSVEYCLKKNNLTLKDIDAIAIPVNAAIYLENFDGAHSAQLRYRGELWHSILSNLMASSPHQLFAKEASQFVSMTDGTNIKIHFIEHHLAHAAIGFYPSEFKEAAILSMDGFGEKDCMMFAHGRGTQIEPISHHEFPHSLGCFYLAITEFLGFQPNSDEWKVMGASSYGDPKKYYSALKNLFKLKGDGYELDLSYFNFYQFHRPLSYSPKLKELLGEPRKPNEKISERHFDIAAAAQKVTEDIIFYLARRLHQKTKSPRLCYTGGVAMNSVANGKILENTPFKEIYIPFAPDDTGGSIGAALYVSHQFHKKPRAKLSHNYLGPSFSDAEIESELKKFGLLYKRSYDPAGEAAMCIANGEIVGWFQGALEFGDRALGNRSILGDPRREEMKDIVNNKVKFREEFRPFAPSTLEEYVGEYFEQSAHTPYMEKVYYVRKNKRKIIPAVVHIDGSGRLQSVRKSVNPLYYDLIKSFQKISGVPIVLNTSFNLKGEPMVGSPKDAVRTFFTCGMDVLFVGPFVIRKR
jgi:carbamoyltransferase